MESDGRDLTRSIRNSFVAGLVLLAPLAVTVFVLGFAFNAVAGYVNPVIQGTSLTRYTGNVEVVAQILTVVTLVVLVTVIGFVATRGFGSRVFDEFDEAMDRVPLVRIIYSSVRQVSNALVSGGNRFDKVVLVRWPRDDIHALGFVTNETPPAVHESLDHGEKTYTVFVPMSPNPTTGHLVVMPESGFEEIDMGVREGLKMVMTTGMTESGEEEAEKEVKAMEAIHEGDGSRKGDA